MKMSIEVATRKLAQVGNSDYYTGVAINGVTDLQHSLSQDIGILTVLTHQHFPTAFRAATSIAVPSDFASSRERTPVALIP
jgi:hypothetical protein